MLIIVFKGEFMRINVYAEEITDNVELINKDGRIGVRFWMHLPVTLGTAQVQGPFMHKPGDDDSSAITFWGKRELKVALKKALDLLEETAPASTNVV